MIHQKYLKSMKLWISGFELSNEMDEKEIVFIGESIDMLSKRKILLKEQLYINVERLGKAKQDFEQHLKNDGADDSDESL